MLATLCVKNIYVLKIFLIFYLFFKINYFLIFSYYFNVLMLKTIFKKIIIIYLQ
jgi:hypothetical protein